MKTKALFILLFLGWVTSTFAQNRVLSIEDFLNISKMKNMEEASALLRNYGYAESGDDEPFYSSEVATFWVKDCKVAHGINCISPVNVYNEYASSVSVLAGYYDRWIEISVYNVKAKEELFQQMQSMGFEFTGNNEYNKELYAKDKDTIIVSQDEYYHLFTFDSLGKQVPLVYTVESSGEMVPHTFMNKDEIERWTKYFQDAGFECIENNENGYSFTKGTDTLRLLMVRDSVWNGYYTFKYYHDNHWPITEDEIEYVPIEDEFVEEFVNPEVMEEEEVMAEEIFTIVEEMPSYRGGEKKMMEYLAKNIIYPQTAREKGIQGEVFVGFIVEPDGSVSNVKVLRGIGGGCDEEAVRVIRSMPKWRPGRQNGIAVRTSYTIPVSFKLVQRLE